MGIGGICIGFEALNCLEDPKELNGFYRDSKKINGLSVYRIISAKNWICPFCCNPLQIEEIDEINKIFDKKKKLKSLSNEYIGIMLKVESEKDIDIFPKLEKIDDEMDELYKDYESFRYYKFKCQKCMKELYFDLGYFFDKRTEYQRYYQGRWKTNKTERDTLIYLRKKFLTDKTEKRYLEEWNELCIEKEAQTYERAKQLCDQEANRIRERYGSIDFGWLSSILDPGFQLLKYRINRVYLVKYVAKFAPNSLDEGAFINYSGHREMTDEELEEFRKFQEMMDKN